MIIVRCTNETCVEMMTPIHLPIYVIGAFLGDSLPHTNDPGSETTHLQPPDTSSSTTRIFFRSFERRSKSSRVEPSLYAMAGPLGHRRQNKKCEHIEFIHIEFIHMRFPPLLVFSSVHPSSKNFVLTISTQFLIPTVWKQSRIAAPRTSPS